MEMASDSEALSVAPFFGQRTHVVKRTKHYETVIRFFAPTGKETANPQPDQRLRYSVRDSGSFLWRGSPPHLIHQHQRPRGRKAYEKKKNSLVRLKCEVRTRTEYHCATCHLIGERAQTLLHVVIVGKSREKGIVRPMQTLFTFTRLRDPCYSPKTCILRRNKTSTHPHDRQEPNLPKVRTLSYAH